MSDEKITHQNPIDQLGFALIAHVIVRDGELSNGALRTYLHYLSYARENRPDAWPSHTRIARELGINIATLTDYKSELINLGYIQLKDRGPKISIVIINDIHKIERLQKLANEFLACHGPQTMTSPSSHGPQTMTSPSSHGPQTMTSPSSHGPQTMTDAKNEACHGLQTMLKNINHDHDDEEEKELIKQRLQILGIYEKPAKTIAEKMAQSGLTADDAERIYTETLLGEDGKVTAAVNRLKSGIFQPRPIVEFPPAPIQADTPIEADPNKLLLDQLKASFSPYSHLLAYATLTRQNGTIILSLPEKDTAWFGREKISNHLTNCLKRLAEFDTITIEAL